MSDLIKNLARVQLKYTNYESITDDEFKLIEAECILINKKQSFLTSIERNRILHIYEMIWRDR